MAHIYIKITLICTNISVKNFDVICLSETFLNFLKLKVKRITTNSTNLHSILTTFRVCFFSPFSSFNDKKIKLPVLQSVLESQREKRVMFNHMTKKKVNWTVPLTLSWRRPLWYRNQPIDLQSKSMDWFLYDNGVRHERVNKNRGAHTLTHD